jgi:hypothetical protein
LSRPRLKWNDIFDIDSQEVGCGRMDCIGLGQDMEMGKLGRKSTLSFFNFKFIYTQVFHDLWTLLQEVIS